MWRPARHIGALVAVGFLALSGCSRAELETSQMWSERMAELIRPGMTRADVEAAMEGRRFTILDEPAEQVRPPRALTETPRGDWHLLVELRDRISCTEQRHVHLRFGPDGRLAERVVRGTMGCI